MIKKNDKFIKYARDKIQKYFSPNIIQYIELEKRTSKLRLQRIMLHEIIDGTYVVSRIAYNCRIEINSIEHSDNLFQSKHKHLALEKIEMLVTELEQDEFDVTDEFSAPICRVARDGWNFHSPTFQHNVAFFGENHQHPGEFLFQKLPAGLQVIVMVNDQGVMSINDLEDTLHIVISDAKVRGNARGFLRDLSQTDGFRSLVLEAIYDGQNLYVTDGSYIHDTDLTSMTFEQRYKVLSKYIGNTQSNKVCGLVEAETLTPQEWGRTSRHGFVKALMARRKNACPSLYQSGGNSERATIVGECEPSYFDCVKVEGDTAILRQPNSRKSTQAYYPSLSNRMMLKSVQIIGSVNPTEKSLIF